jgi:hypothetical protein
LYFISRPHIFVLVKRVAILISIAGLVEHPNGFGEWDNGGLVQPDEILVRKLALHNFDLSAVIRVDAGEDGLEGAIEHAEDFVIVLVDGHLQI